MKFGKRFLKAQRPDWTYLDYKALKQLLKLLFVPSSNHSLAAEFETELLHGVESVNAFFVAKERELLSALPPHVDLSGSEQQAAADDYFREVCELYGYVILNYLAVLKIVKKHEKHVSALAQQQRQQQQQPFGYVSAQHRRPQPLRGAVLDVLFSQAFYLSLEHSFLFDSCKQYLQDRDTANGRSAATGFLVGASPLRSAIDFSALRACHREGPVDSATTRAIEMQIECLLALAGGPTFHADRRDDADLAPLNGHTAGTGAVAGAMAHSMPSRIGGICSPHSSSSSSALAHVRIHGSSQPLPCHSPEPKGWTLEGMDEAGSDWAANTAALWGVRSLDAGASRSWAGGRGRAEGAAAGAAGAWSRNAGGVAPMRPARRTLGFHANTPSPSALAMAEPSAVRAQPPGVSPGLAALPKQPRTREERGTRLGAGEGGEEETARAGRRTSPPRSPGTLSVHVEEGEEGMEEQPRAAAAAAVPVAALAAVAAAVPSAPADSIPLPLAKVPCAGAESETRVVLAVSLDSDEELFAIE